MIITFLFLISKLLTSKVKMILPNSVAQFLLNFQTKYLASQNSFLQYHNGVLWDLKFSKQP